LSRILNIEENPLFTPRLSRILNIEEIKWMQKYVCGIDWKPWERK